MNVERLEVAKSVLVGALMAVAFIVIGPPEAAQDMEPALAALVDHSPPMDGPYMTQLVSE